MPTIAIVEPHTLYRLGIIRLLTEALPSAKLVGMDYTALDIEAEKQHCELLLLSVPSVEASHILLSVAEHKFQTEAALLMAETLCDLPSPQNSPAMVMGHILKNSSAKLMIASINLVLAGGTCFAHPHTETLQEIVADAPLSLGDADSVSTSFCDELVVAPYKPKRWPPEEKQSGALQADEAQLLGITPRQYEVLVLLARGMTIKGVARELEIAAATAKAHAETLYMRMNVCNRNEAVYQAVAKGARLGIPMWVA